MIVDSHCHLDCLDLMPYDGELHKTIAAAREKDVGAILCPGILVENFPNILKIVETDVNLFAAVGTHPTEKSQHQTTLDELLEFGQNKKVVGIGETGLDFYYAKDENEREYQKKLFKLHIQAAKILSKPLIIHSRDAEDDIIKILLEENAATVGGILHCFTGSQMMAEKVIELGFCVSFSGIVTFPKAQALKVIAKNLPLDKILIETDAPYLAPVPVRGKSNEPIYLHYIAEYIAKLRGTTYEEIAAQTTENFWRLCKR